MTSMPKTLRDKVDASEVFVVLGTENYVRSLRDPDAPEHYIITEQIIVAKDLCKPIVLIIDQLMEQKDMDYLRNYFKGFKRVEELPLHTKEADAYIKNMVTNLLKWLEEYHKKDLPFRERK